MNLLTFDVVISRQRSNTATQAVNLLISYIKQNTKPSISIKNLLIFDVFICRGRRRKKKLNENWIWIVALRRFCKIWQFGRSLNSLFYKATTAHGKSATFWLLYIKKSSSTAYGKKGNIIRIEKKRLLVQMHLIYQ